MITDGSKVGDGPKRMKGNYPPIDLIRILKVRQDSLLGDYPKGLGFSGYGHRSSSFLSSYPTESNNLDLMKAEHFSKNEK